MLKNFFAFNRSQQFGIITMIALIVLVLLGTWLMPGLIKPKTEARDDKFLREAAKFRENLIEIERSRQKRFEDDNHFFRSYPEKTFEKNKYELFSFDPNNADSVSFIRLGLKPYVARNIIRYRNKGGKFRTPDDFARVYGIAPEKFLELKPFISIETTKAGSEANNRTETTGSEILSEKKNLTTNTIIELNSADTTALLQVKGIGASTARGIASYRNLLGGYYSVEQLKEVYGMRNENFNQIKSRFTVDASQIRKINVNSAGVDRLKKHPYIKTFQKAVAIYEYRRKKTKLDNISDLKILDELSEEDINRLEPYLEFN